MQTTTTTTNWIDKALAWGVHLFTASGLLTGFMALVAVSAHQWREAMWWLIASLLIDGLDGTLARAAKVREVLPTFNGKNLDYVIDFATYAIIPTYFFFEAGLAEGPWLWICTFTMLIVSGFYYGKEGMVADDEYFVGFPVLWNLVVFFLLFVFDLPSWANTVFVLAFAVLHFIPIKYAYPSRARKNGRIILFMAWLSLVTLIAITYLYPDVPPVLRWLVVIEGAFFGLLGVWTTYFTKKP
jgi:phosphatidylcholine synthase